MTYHAVLNAEAELILGVGPLDLHLNNRGAGHCRQLHHRLVLRVLREHNNNKGMSWKLVWIDIIFQLERLIFYSSGLNIMFFLLFSMRVSYFEQRRGL